MPERTPIPPLRYRLAPCPACGATREEDAETLCRPTTDETGERSCIGEFDRDGNSVQPTKESLDALNQWCDEQGRLDEMSKLLSHPREIPGPWGRP